MAKQKQVEIPNKTEAEMNSAEMQIVDPQPHIPSHHSDDEAFAALIPPGTLPFGNGTTREVYEVAGHPDKVLKVSKGGSNAANWTEAVVYGMVTDNSMFGAVLSISRTGRYLVMERLNDLLPGEAAGMMVPKCWTDRKSSNMGRGASGAIKIRDYALVNLQTGGTIPLPSQADIEEMARLNAIVRSS